MSRLDAVGLWWADHPVHKERGSGTRTHVRTANVEPPVTNWTPPRDFPNLAGAKVLGLDTETKDLEMDERGPGAVRGAAHAVGVSIACETQAWYFPLRHEYGPQTNLNMDPAKVFAWLKDQLARPVPIVGANLLYDLEVLRAEGVPLPAGELFDVQFAEPLLDENARSYSLDTLMRKYTGAGKETPALYQWCADSFGGQANEHQRANIWRSPPTLVGPYAEVDALGPLEIFAKQRKVLAEEELTELFRMECGLIPLLLDMRFRGVRIDVAKARETGLWLRAQAKVAQALIPGVDVWSGESMAAAFDKAGVPYLRTEAGNPSFTRLFLESTDHPLAKAVLDVRLYEKAANPFIESYLLGNVVGDHVHCRFNPLRSDDYGTVSGRLSSSDPNLQNIPARHEVIGPMLRGLFIPEAGGRWRRQDYSQIEYRGLSHYAVGKGAEAVRQRYRDDPKTDFHEMTQHMVLDVTGVSLGRKASKNLNFGLCLAAGTQVLTDTGLVPIERVTMQHRVWDGLDWVRHDGVVCNGQKEVITYDGLTGTPSHIVWTEQGHAISLGAAASQVDRPRLAVTACAQSPVRLQEYPGVHGQNEQGRLAYTGQLHTLPQNALAAYRQLGARALKELSMCTTQSSYRKVLRAIMGLCQPSLYPANEQCLQKLWRAWHTDAVHAGGFYNLLHETLFDGEDYQGALAAGPAQQRWALCTGEHSLRYGAGERCEQAGAHVHPFTADPRAYETGVDPGTSACTGQANEPHATAFVYDIVNAGPNHRFTANGKLVHNCYGMGKDKLQKSLGVSGDLGQRMYDAYFEAMPSVKATYKAAERLAKRRGYIKTILNRRRRFPGGENTHKALNALLQGTAADIMKRAMYEIYRAGLTKVLGAPHLTVHDELDWTDMGTPECVEAFAEVENIMVKCVPMRVPLLVDVSTGANWAEAA